MKLAEGKSIESITVKELTDTAGLNRGTFYLHYLDMTDFVEKLKGEILEEYHSIIKKLGHHSGGTEPFIDPPAGFLRPFEFVLENKHFFKVFLASTGEMGFYYQMNELLKQQFQYSFLVKHRDMKAADIPIKHLYLFSYLASAYMGSLQLWIQRNFDLSPKEMAVLFSSISRLGSANLQFKD